MVNSTLLDENWQPIYPHEVPIGGTAYAQTTDGRYIEYRRVSSREGETVRFEVVRDDRGFARLHTRAPQ